MPEPVSRPRWCSVDVTKPPIAQRKEIRIDGTSHFNIYRPYGVGEGRLTQDRPKAYSWKGISRAKRGVIFTLCITGYTAYVYIGKFCLPMINERYIALGSSDTGYVLVTLFCAMYLWIIWACVKIILTPPGYAKDYIPESRHPVMSQAPSTVAGSKTEPPNKSEIPNSSSQPITRRDSELIAGTSHEGSVNRANDQEPKLNSTQGTMGREERNKDPGAEITKDAASGSALGRLPTTVAHMSAELLNATSRETVYWRFMSESRLSYAERNQLQMLKHRRRPPTKPVLHPMHRYCHIDGIVQPYRAKHCDACGTCVLKYHCHCALLGRCIGARNYKFFVNLSVAMVVLAFYILGTLWVFNLNYDISEYYIGVTDWQIMLMMAFLSPVITCFAVAWMLYHVKSIIKNQTMWESGLIDGMKKKENAALRWLSFRLKQRAKKQWDEEWGDIDTEGNIWWTGGSKLQTWMEVMGRNPLGWIFPVGHSDDDGLSYQVNPRFDELGVLRRRADWPAELR